MPLDPKQQPPYYTPGTTPTPGGQTKFIRLNEQHAPIQTSGTTETDLYTYTLPANTLIENGDGLEIYYTCIGDTPAESHITRFYFNGVNEATDDVIPNIRVGWRIQIVKLTSTTAYIVSQKWTNSETGKPTTQQAAFLNFTTPIIIKFTGQCTGTALIQAELMTIDKQLL